jgi:hypothetical protein
MPEKSGLPSAMRGTSCALDVVAAPKTIAAARTLDTNLDNVIVHPPVSR